MARPKVRTIRAATHPLGTGDFTTIQAWEDFVDDKANPYQWAECYSGSNLGTFTMSGWSSTPTASGYPRIYAASGDLHLGNLDRGPVIAVPSGTTAVNTISVSYTRIEGIGSTRGFELDLDSASNIKIEKCWATSQDGTCFKAKSVGSATSSSGNVIQNCVALGTNTQDIGFDLGGQDMIMGKPQIDCFHNTCVGHKNTGIRVFNTKTMGFYGGANVSVKNCISVDSFGSDFSFVPGGNGSITTSNNISSDTSSLGISNQNSSNIFKNSDKALFWYAPSSGVVKVVASGDFRLHKSSVARNRAEVIPSVSDDFRGIKRAFPNTPDVGAYEFGFFNKKFALYVQGPVPVSSGVDLHMHAEKEQPASGVFDLYAQSLGAIRIQSSGNSAVGSGVPSLYLEAQAPAKINASGTLFVQSLGVSKIQSSGNSPVGSGHPFLYVQSLGPSKINASGTLFVQSLGAIAVQSSGNSPVGSGHPSLFVQSLGAIKSSGNVDLALTGFRSHEFLKLAMPAHAKITNTATLHIGAAIPDSGFVSLNIGNFTFKRKSPLFLRTDDQPTGSLVTIDKFLTTLTESTESKFSTLFLQAKPHTNSAKISLQNKQPLPSGSSISTNSFIEDSELADTSQASLQIQGFSGIRGPESNAIYRYKNVFSDGYLPFQRKATAFLNTERNCGDGSLYSLENNTNDNSSDYEFKLYASGFNTSEVDSSLFQTSSRFGSTAIAGTGVIRFKGDSSNYLGTILMQSGSPSDSDQHRLHPKRRGITTSFWINKNKGIAPGISTALGGIRGIIGNLELNNGSRAASGEWGIYYLPHNASLKASGSSPFNATKDIFQRNHENLIKIDFSVLGGLFFYVNTTAGGNMGRLLRASKDTGELIQENLPGTMMPMEEDRWYYINFWIDTTQNTSYCRIASPAKGIAGESGYMPEIKPMTDKTQKWDGYEVKTDTDSLKLKVGGGLFREAGSLPYYNLGYSLLDSEKHKESFLIDEIKVSNNVCSKNAMEQIFDEDYAAYTKQFRERRGLRLYISGSSSGIPLSSDDTDINRPIAVSGYYPLYTVPEIASANAGSGLSTYHTHIFNGLTYYMPDGLTMGVNQFHGGYVAPEIPDEGYATLTDTSSATTSTDDTDSSDDSSGEDVDYGYGY